MKTNQRYFGLEFSGDFAYGQEAHRQVAKFLFANPYTLPEEARRIMNSLDEWTSVDQLVNSLKIEVEKISQLNFSAFDEAKVQNPFVGKTFSWAYVFSCPTLREVQEVEKLFQTLPKNFLLDHLLIAVCDDRMPSQKIVDYLLNYISALSVETTDYLLDMFKAKSAETCNLIPF